MLWTAAVGTRVTHVLAIWVGVDDHTPARGWGTVQLTQGTDRQLLFAQNSPLSVGFGVSGAPPFEAEVAPASWFDIRFTCLDQCPVGSDGVDTVAHVIRARFDLDDSSAPVGGLTGG